VWKKFYFLQLLKLYLLIGWSHIDSLDLQDLLHNIYLWINFVASLDISHMEAPYSKPLICIQGKKVHQNIMLDINNLSQICCQSKENRWYQMNTANNRIYKKNKYFHFYNRSLHSLYKRVVWITSRHTLQLTRHKYSLLYLLLYMNLKLCNYHLIIHILLSKVNRLH